MPKWLQHTLLVAIAMFMVVSIVSAMQVSSRNDDLDEINRSVRVIRGVADAAAEQQNAGASSSTARAVQEIHNLCLTLQSDYPELECPGG